MSPRKRKKKIAVFRVRLRDRLCEYFQVGQELGQRICDEAMLGLVFLHHQAYAAHEAEDVAHLEEIRATYLLLAERFDFEELALMAGGLASENSSRRVCCLTGLEALLNGIGLNEVDVVATWEEE